MNKFEDELKTGNFVTSECNHCNRIVWPPSNYCDNCFREVNWRKVSENGIIIELYPIHDVSPLRYFCFSGNEIRVFKAFLSRSL